MSERPRVAFVGGLDRLERELETIGNKLGVDVEVHHGRTGGNGASRLAALVRRTGLVVIITGTNSHNAALVAKREAMRAGVPFRILNHCGLAAARAVLEGVRCSTAALRRPTSARCLRAHRDRCLRERDARESRPLQETPEGG